MSSILSHLTTLLLGVVLGAVGAFILFVRGTE